MKILYKGIDVFYKDEGQGPSLIFLHGFLENSTIWNDIIPHLIKNYRVISIDLLGHGKTGCIGYIHTMEDMAQAVRFVINHLKLKKYTLLGHSMGGYVALAYTEKYPDHIKGLCLINSTSRADSPERKLNRNRAIRAVKQNHKTFIRLAISNLFRPKNRKIFSHKIKELKKEALNMSLQGIVAALEGMKIRPDREVLLHFSPYKKMMIISKKDPILKYENLIEEIQNTDVHIIEFPDGHMSFIENEGLFLQTIMHFIENI